MVKDRVSSNDVTHRGIEGTESNHAYIAHIINSAMVAAVDPDSPELKHLRALWMIESPEEREQRIACERPAWSMNGIMPNGGLKDLKWSMGQVRLVRWLCIDIAAVTNVDYSAAETLFTTRWTTS